MYTFSRPPLLRYIGAVLLILVSLWWDTRAAPTELRPFARVEIAAGTPLKPDLFEQVAVPVGLLPPVAIEGSAGSTLSKGDPLTVGAVTLVSAPPGWWTVELELPQGASIGTEIQIALLGTSPTQPTKTIPGLVISPGGESTSFQPEPGLVAVPERWVADVAASLSQNRVVVFLGSHSPRPGGS